MQIRVREGEAWKRSRGPDFSRERRDLGPDRAGVGQPLGEVLREERGRQQPLRAEPREGPHTRRDVKLPRVLLASQSVVHRKHQSKATLNHVDPLNFRPGTGFQKFSIIYHFFEENTTIDEIKVMAHI